MYGMYLCQELWVNLNTLGGIFLPSWALRAPFHEKICILFGTCAKQVTNMYLTVRYTRSKAFKIL